MADYTGAIRAQWNEWSDTWYPQYRTDEVIEGVIRDPKSVFHPELYALLTSTIGDMRGKRICVPSSGDNHAVFAFHLMGAHVTSCDLSERQLEHAAAIARRHGWSIEFKLQDTMQLDGLADESYDFVFTSNGVHVWIHDLASMYANIGRILKPVGSYVTFDVHPFMRPFGTMSLETMRVAKPYDAIRPPGELPLFHWRMKDVVNAMLQSGFRLHRMEELAAADGTFWIDDSLPDQDKQTEEQLARLCDWSFNPLAALPQWLVIHAQKA